MSERRKRLHDLLLTLINKDSEFEFIEGDSSDLTSSYSEKDTLNLSRVIEKNRKIIKRYQAEFLRDLDFETWQLVAYKSPLFEDKLILRVIGYPGNLRIDHPTELRVESGRKKWLLEDKTLLNVELANDGRQAAAEFDLDELIKNIDKNRPLRLSLSGVFSELPVPPFVVKEWRSLS